MGAGSRGIAVSLVDVLATEPCGRLFRVGRVLEWVALWFCQRWLKSAVWMSLPS